jgi:hypothetical protein
MLPFLLRRMRKGEIERLRSKTTEKLMAETRA